MAKSPGKWSLLAVESEAELHHSSGPSPELTQSHGMSCRTGQAERWKQSQRTAPAPAVLKQLTGHIGLVQEWSALIPSLASTRAASSRVDSSMAKPISSAHFSPPCPAPILPLIPSRGFFWWGFLISFFFIFKIPSLTDSDSRIKYWIIYSMSCLISWVKVKQKQLSQIMRCQTQQLRPRKDLEKFFLPERETQYFSNTEC